MNTAAGYITAIAAAQESDGGINWIPLGAQVLVLVGVIITVIWGQRHQRNQPLRDENEAGHIEVDSDRLRKTIEQMNEQSNARRDFRLAQFHSFLLLDAEWHLLVITNERKLIGIIKELVAIVKDLGGDISHIVIPDLSPPPPAVPDPPPVHSS